MEPTGRFQPARACHFSRPRRMIGRSHSFFSRCLRPCFYAFAIAPSCYYSSAPVVPSSADQEDELIEAMQQNYLIELTADIVAAYVSTNTVAPDNLTTLVQDVHKALHRTATGAVELEAPPLAPAVSVKKSVTPDYLICLEDGKKFKSLKRHLRTHYDLTPEEYRHKWGLPASYPMVAPNYAKARSALAKKMGLGRKAAR